MTDDKYAGIEKDARDECRESTERDARFQKTMDRGSGLFGTREMGIPMCLTVTGAGWMTSPTTLV